MKLHLPLQLLSALLACCALVSAPAYALDLGAKTASFSAFRRTAENPEIRIVKDPALRQKQGEWILYGEAGAILKRGHDLASILAPVERRLVKLVEA